jgi:hypothetical protein
MNDPVPFPLRAVAPPDLRARVEEVFTPSSPVIRRDLFAGRGSELQQLLDMVRQPGRHPVLFGEPRTGKTSLATIVPEFAAEPLGFVCVTAVPGDTFDSLWRRAAESVRTALRRAERGLASAMFPDDTPTTLARAEAAGHDDVLALLARLTAGAPAWIVFDDFDRVEDADTRRRMRALAEATASAAPRATLVFAGSATSGDALLEPSSSLVPVQVSRLSNDECIEVVLRALRQVGLVAEDVVVERIATLSNGLPHVTQALARAAARAAGDAGRGTVTNPDLDHAVRTVIAEAPEALQSAYEQATVRARRGIYPEILLACALSPRDAYGTFSVADVGATVTNIVRREVRGLTNQVSALTEEGRGSVLDKRGSAKSARYRFVDPSLEPYILMRGLEEGWTTHHTPSWLPEPSEAMDLPKAA